LNYSGQGMKKKVLKNGGTGRLALNKEEGHLEKEAAKHAVVTAKNPKNSQKAHKRFRAGARLQADKGKEGGKAQQKKCVAQNTRLKGSGSRCTTDSDLNPGGA